MPRRIAQLLVVPALTGCIGSSEPDTVVTFRVVDHLGGAVPDAVITCSGTEPVGGDATQTVEGAVADLGTGVDFTCTIPLEDPGGVRLGAETATESAELWPGPSVSDVRDVVVWRPEIEAALAGESVAVTWAPSPVSPDPTWTPRLSLIGWFGSSMFGSRDLDASATSFTFPLEDLEDGGRELELWASFDHPVYGGVDSLHHARFEAPAAAPVVPGSRGAACQLVYRYETLDEPVDFPAGDCPFTDGDVDWITCYETGVPCDVIGGTIDLGTIVPVRRIRVHQDTTWDDRTISISEDGVSFTVLEAYDPLPAPASARYVRVASEDGFWEISVF